MILSICQLNISKIKIIANKMNYLFYGVLITSQWLTVISSYELLINNYLILIRSRRAIKLMLCKLSHRCDISLIY